MSAFCRRSASIKILSIGFGYLLQILENHASQIGAKLLKLKQFVTTVTNMGGEKIGWRREWMQL